MNSRPLYMFCIISSSVQVCVVITKDCDKHTVAYKTYLLVDRGPQGGGQPNHARLGLWGPRQISAHEPPPLAAHEPNCSNQSRNYCPCNCRPAVPMSSLLLFYVSSHIFILVPKMSWRHAAPTQSCGSNAEGRQERHGYSYAFEVYHLLCQQRHHHPGPDDELVRAPGCKGSVRQAPVQKPQGLLTAQQALETAGDCLAALTLKAMQ